MRQIFPVNQILYHKIARPSSGLRDSPQAFPTGITCDRLTVAVDNATYAAGVEADGWLIGFFSCGGWGVHSLSATPGSKILFLI